MGRFVNRVAGLVVAVCVLVAPADLRAIDPPASTDTPASVDDGLRTLLANHWGRGVDNRSAAERLGRQLQQLAPHDPRVPYALSLVRINNLQYGEALELAEPLARQHPEFLEGRRVYVWLLVARGRYSPALTEMRKLAETLATTWNDAGRDDPPPSELIEQAEQLGRLMAFLQGPISESLGEAELAATRRRIDAALAGPLLRAFLSAHLDVTNDYRQRLGDLDETRMTADAEAILRAQVERNEREQTQSAVEETLERLREADDQGAAAAQARLRILQQQLAGLERRLSQVEGERTQLMLQFSRLRAEVENLFLLAESAETELERERWLFEANRASARSRQVEDRFAVVEAEYQNLLRQANGIRTESQQVTLAEQQARAARTAERNRAQAVLRRTMRDEARAQGPVTGDRAPRVRDSRARLRALPLYDPFPVAEQRDLLLERL